MTDGLRCVEEHNRERTYKWADLLGVNFFSCEDFTKQRWDVFS